MDKVTEENVLNDWIRGKNMLKRTFIKILCLGFLYKMQQQQKTGNEIFLLFRNN